MYTGQLMIYKFNGLHNAIANANRNIYSIYPIQSPTKEEFQSHIVNALDEVPPGRGYVIVKWKNQFYMCQKDPNNPNHPYVRTVLKWHPLLDKFNP